MRFSASPGLCGASPAFFSQETRRIQRTAMGSGSSAKHGAVGQCDGVAVEIDFTVVGA